MPAALLSQRAPPPPVRPLPLPHLYASAAAVVEADDGRPRRHGAIHEAAYLERVLLRQGPPQHREVLEGGAMYSLGCIGFRNNPLYGHTRPPPLHGNKPTQGD